MCTKKCAYIAFVGGVKGRLNRRIVLRHVVRPARRPRVAIAQCAAAIARVAADHTRRLHLLSVVERKRFRGKIIRAKLACLDADGRRFQSFELCFRVAATHHVCERVAHSVSEPCAKIRASLHEPVPLLPSLRVRDPLSVTAARSFSEALLQHHSRDWTFRVVMHSLGLSHDDAPRVF